MAYPSIRRACFLAVSCSHEKNGGLLLQFGQRPGQTDWLATQPGCEGVAQRE
jgi:hypothetical protein